MVACSDQNAPTAEVVEGGAGATSAEEAKETVEEEKPRLPTLEDVVFPTEAPPDGPTQHSLCMPAIREPVVANTLYYCLPAPWLKMWQRYGTQSSMSAPSMIDNAPLVATITADIVLVKKEFIPGQDYEIIPESAWKRFVAWYESLQAHTGLAPVPVQLSANFPRPFMASNARFAPYCTAFFGASPIFYPIRTPN